MAPSWNDPQGEKNVHTSCTGKPEPDDRGNNICAKLNMKAEYNYY